MQQVKSPWPFPKDRSGSFSTMFATRVSTRIIIKDIDATLFVRYFYCSEMVVLVKNIEGILQFLQKKTRMFHKLKIRNHCLLIHIAICSDSAAIWNLDRDRFRFNANYTVMNTQELIPNIVKTKLHFFNQCSTFKFQKLSLSFNNNVHEG